MSKLQGKIYSTDGSIKILALLAALPMFLDSSQTSAGQTIKPRLQSAACHGSLARVA